MTRTHAAKSTSLTDEERARRARGADLCRRDPALWSRLVRYEDQLVREGMSPGEAREQAERAILSHPA